MEPQSNEVDTNNLESIGKGKRMKHSRKKTTAWMEDGDSAHWLKSQKKRPERKASSANETKKRFKANTLTVKMAGKKKTRVKK